MESRIRVAEDSAYCPETRRSRVMLSRISATASLTSVIERRTRQVAGSRQSSQISSAVRLAHRILRHRTVHYAIELEADHG